MKKMLHWFEHQFQHPTPEEPPFSGVVERWYQLDAPAYGLPLAYVAWTKGGPLPRPSALILASSSGSNETDRAFVRGGAVSPAKFVHTLPNVRSSTLCQVMEWSGPILCIAQGKQSFARGLEEGVHLSEQLGGQVWVISAIQTHGGYSVYMCNIGGLPKDCENSLGEFSLELKCQKFTNRQTCDADIFDWFKTTGAPRCVVSNDLVLTRSV